MRQSPDMVPGAEDKHLISIKLFQSRIGRYSRSGDLWPRADRSIVWINFVLGAFVVNSIHRDKQEEKEVEKE